MTDRTWNQDLGITLRTLHFDTIYTKCRIVHYVFAQIQVHLKERECTKYLHVKGMPLFFSLQKII